jgi:hypothetical protein
MAHEEVRGFNIQNKQKAKGGSGAGALDVFSLVMQTDYSLAQSIIGHRRLYLQIVFRNVGDLLAVRKDTMPLALANSAKLTAVGCLCRGSARGGGGQECLL